MPIATDCTEPFKLMKVPRTAGTAAEVMSAMAGMKRPETKTKYNVVMTSEATSVR